MNEVTRQEYENFILQNRTRVNRYLNIALLCFTITGPAIALGVKAGFFPDVTYTACLVISLYVLGMSLIHYILMKKMPKSLFTALFALTALDILLVYMTYSHVNIFLTWFLVPILSLLFCDKIIFCYSVCLNYVLMFTTTWLTASYQVALRDDYVDAAAYFRDVMGGYTIETVILSISAYMIGKLTEDHYRELFRQYGRIKSHEKEMGEKMKLLESMVEIYDNVNYINFIDSTEMSLRDNLHTKHDIDMSTQTHTIMSQGIKANVMPDQTEAYLNFTNIKTVRARLSQKKIISADFIDVVKGWFRAQYITVDSTIDGIPNSIIFTTRNVDDEKRREEHLIRISMTDEMTRLYNRRCYDEDLDEYRKLESLEEDFVLFSVDVNGLKSVNDTKGHAAGDELIKGAANCLALIIGHKGKVYRTGGDEFMAIVHTDNPEELREEIQKKASEWHGVYIDKVTLSVGYATTKEHIEAKVDELERLADADMYMEKEKYYKSMGIERRR